MRTDDACPIMTVESTQPPGTDGLWTFVFIDMVLFLMIFFMFMSERMRHVDQYVASQLRLDELVGLANTLILLTSSWMVVEGIHAARKGDSTRVRRPGAAHRQALHRATTIT